MVLNLGLIEPQGFVESVSGVRQRSRILRLFLCEIHVLLVLFFEIYTYLYLYFIFQITKGAVNALMKLAGFSTSNKVNNH